MATLLAVLPLTSALAVHLTGVTQLEAVGEEDNVGVALAWSNPAGFPDGGLASGARDPEYVLIGRDNIFPDNLASGALQGPEGPLLLTPTDELDDRVVEEIDRLGVDRAIILGETEAISEDVENDLGDLVGTVDRLGGITRIETAIEVCRESGATTAILARAFDADGGSSSQAFVDALAAGAWAATEDYCVLLTQTETLTESTADFLGEGGINAVIVVGGTDAVSQDTEDAAAAIVADTTRVGGANRAATAVLIAQARGYETAGDAPGIILLEGFEEDAWAEGFAAAATSALEDYPVVLSNGEALPPETETYASGTPNPDTNLVCGVRTSAAACAEFVALTGTIDVNLDDTTLEDGDDVTGTINAPEGFTVTVSGCGYSDEEVTVEDDGSFTLPDFPASSDLDDEGEETGTCALTFTFTDAEGNQFTRTVIITIEGPPGPPPPPPPPVSTVVTSEAPDLRSATINGANVDFCYDEAVAVAVATQFSVMGPNDVDYFQATSAAIVADNSLCVRATFPGNANLNARTLGVSEQGAVRDFNNNFSILDSTPLLGSTLTAFVGRTIGPDLVDVTVDSTLNRATFIFDETVASLTDPPGANPPIRFQAYTAAGTQFEGTSATVSGTNVTVQYAAGNDVDDFTLFGVEFNAVTDTEGSANPNPEGDDGGSTSRPELVDAVPGPAQNQFDFNFDEDVVVIGAAGFLVYLDDGTRIASNNAVSVDNNTVRASFPLPVAGLDDFPNETVTVASVVDGQAVSATGNPLDVNTTGAHGIAQVNQGAGFTVGPDLVSATFDNATGQVTFTFDEDLDEVPGSTDFDEFAVCNAAALCTDGTAVVDVTSPQVTIQFPAGTVANAVAAQVDHPSTDAQAPDGGGFAALDEVLNGNSANAVGRV